MKRPVLVVDDDQDIRETVALVLRAKGFGVELAADGVEALEHLERGGSPSLILLDLRMPRMNGLELLRELRARRWQLPVVVLTGDHAAAAEAARSGAKECLIKPVDLDALLGAVERFGDGPA